MEARLVTWCGVNIFGTTSSTGALANMKFEAFVVLGIVFINKL